MLLGSTSPSELIMLTIVFVISFTVHEFSHGFVSYLQGDNTAKEAGRLTLNPFSHIDMLGLLAIFIIRFGWAKPVPTSPNNYKNKRLGILLTSLAGPVSNLLLAFLAALIGLAINTQNSIVEFFFEQLIYVNTTLAIFNFIPIPPLDGSKIFASLFGGKIAEYIYRLQKTGMVLVFLIFLIPPVENALWSLINIAQGQIIKLAYMILFH